jgi:Helix-turn-helix domain
MPQNITDTGRRAHSIAETCALTGLGRDTVYTAIRDGQLGRRTLITDDDLRQFLAGLPRAGGHEQVAVRSTEAEQARERA